MAHAHAELHAALTTLHRAAGMPTARIIAAAVKCSHTTVSTALNGRTVPSWRTLSRIVVALEGQPEAMQPLWQAYQNARPESARHRGPRAAAFQVRLALADDCVMAITASRRPTAEEWTATLDMLAIVADPTKARR